MNVGNLAILFGLKLNHASFQGAFAKLASLQAAISGITGLTNIASDLTHMAIEAAHAGTHILGTSQALGLSTKSMQEWSYVAERAGSNTQQFLVGMGMFERNLREFAAGRGSKRFKDAMHDIHMSTNDVRHALVGEDGVNGAIFKVSDAYLKMGNSANRGAINSGLFGARAREMAQDLGQGSAALKEQIKHLHEIGGIVDDDKLKGLKEFNSALVDIKTAWYALVLTIVGGLGPSFSKMIEGVTKWFGENREFIGEVMVKAFHMMAVGFKIAFFAFKMFADFVSGVMNGKLGPTVLFSMMIAAATLLAAIIWTVLLPSVVALGSAIFAAMLPLLPWTLLLGAIIALVLLLQAHWRDIGAAIAWAAGKVRDFFVWIGTEVSKAIDWLDSLGQRIVSSFDESINAVKEKFMELLDWLASQTQGPIGKLLSGVTGVSYGAVGDMYQQSRKSEKQARGNVPIGFNPEGQAMTPHSPSVSTGRATANGMSERANKAGRMYGMTVPNTGSRTVTVAPTTINIYGVKDAKEAKDRLAETIEAQHRHAAAALGGETE